MEIVFDPAKDAANRGKHGVPLMWSRELFRGRVVTRVDTRADYGEVRYISYGRIGGRMFVCVWTLRRDARRVISLRKANGREERRYGPEIA